MVRGVEPENRPKTQAPAKNGQELTTSTLHEEFFALVCADDELLRAEFAAIIDAAWNEPPTPPERRQPGPVPEQVDRCLAASALTATAARPHPGVGGWARQRSPPPQKPSAGERP